MGSTGATAVLLSCVVLSIVAAGSAASDKPLIISNEALLASAPEASPSSARRLGGIPMGTEPCPLQLGHMKRLGKIQGSCFGQAIPQRRCCTAFKDFLCPYGATMNDVDNGCAAEMMATIQQLCQVPKGYFVMCGDSAEGITCSPH